MVRYNVSYGQMNKSTFLIGTNAKGLEYFYQKQEELDKNHRQDDMHNSTSEGRIYAISGKKFQNILKVHDHCNFKMKNSNQSAVPLFICSMYICGILSNVHLPRILLLYFRAFQKL